MLVAPLLNPQQGAGFDLAAPREENYIWLP